MRALTKGLIPTDKNFKSKVYLTYSQAKDDLRDRLGSYCAYCEAHIGSNFTIDHVCPKSKNKSLTLLWENFLPACMTCNRAKSDTNECRIDYLFPDLQNTSFLYEYSEIEVKVKKSLPSDIKKLAQKTFDLVKLDRQFDSSKNTDNRAYERNLAWNKAQEALKSLNARHLKEDYDYQIAANQCSGFFTLWLQIFKDYPEVKRKILENVPGSAMECYDRDYNPIPLLNF